jgi:hypothetical protein
MIALAVGVVAVKHRRRESPAKGRSSRRYAHSRPVFDLPAPGASTGTSVSSACTRAPDMKCRSTASTSGRSSAADCRPSRPASTAQARSRRAHRSRYADTAADGRHIWRPAHARAELRRPGCGGSAARRRSLRDCLAGTAEEVRPHVAEHEERVANAQIRGRHRSVTLGPHATRQRENSIWAPVFKTAFPDFGNDGSVS